eukprot:CAMPEP_0172544536 /NCGR_PEP_ID=MMETSP1067-20121228/14669_1 /TAXON_ID=265564 ORGANISM="Thalassiosira punctigera, Strain Tpunct2005C2" /NCGR_SAMPLE_ID=MMETSP1067 /ASSEMBLY_ACC=CAM_ASM_000444 /LENGTH=234 /DNA_ID=CAMNT_0013331113 /DNA_START=136 /DNA_END=840 /DNA_ORIENTATION=+
MDQNSDIDAWRRVHRRLTLALIQSRDNIAAELTKRRYILEEMNRCKMQNTQKAAPGSSNSSKAKKKVAPKKAVLVAAKKEKAPAVVVAGKVKKIPPSTMTSAHAAKFVPAIKANKATPKLQSKLGGQKNDGVVNESGMASIVAPSAMGIGGGGSPDNQPRRGESDGGELLHSNTHFSGITPHQLTQMYYPPAPYSMYGNMGIAMATPEQMGLAVQMMQQINQNATTEEEDPNDV